MKKLILLLLSFSFIFVGCSSKTQIVWEDKPVCIEQQKIDRLEPIKVRVYKDDVEVVRAYKESIDSSISFYENQVERNNTFCKEVTNESK